MNVLILNGSPRKNGITTQVINKIEKTMSSNHQIETVHIYRSKIAPCFGCEKCRPDKACILPEDDAHEIAKKIHSADMLVVSSPTYWGNISGPLKTLFDRTVPVFEHIEGYRIKHVQKEKKAVIVTASSAPWPINLLPSQSAGAVKAMRTVLKAGGYKITDVINIAGAATFEKRKDKFLAGIASKYKKI